MQSPPETAADRVIRKAARRFLWLLFLLFMFSFIDRANVGMAALTMDNDLGISASQFALSLTSFSVAYFLCEIPSNLILERVGARIWIARIAITWGLASAAWSASPRPASHPAPCSTSPTGSRNITAPASTPGSCWRSRSPWHSAPPSPAS
jgi:MFS family permease